MMTDNPWVLVRTLTGATYLGRLVARSADYTSLELSPVYVASLPPPRIAPLFGGARSALLSLSELIYLNDLPHDTRQDFLQAVEELEKASLPSTSTLEG